MSRRPSRRQRLELLLGFLTMVTQLTLVGAVAGLLSATPGVVPSLLLLACVVAWGLTFRAWRRAGS
ncbi:MAG: hypothetical protein LPK23_16490 [Rhodococcus sp. (in: high G+C Gram-positive bacteria)]|nr:hypothetical protein [Rhodococcus sp. (in: high G+C Gram-positive bacteria)]MDX5455901.1 hypothetical protein [Rhodococcus sp. (in: high G+C Gram-positive bacteria)]